MSKYFSEKDIEGYKQCFMLYANDGFVSSPEKLGFIMRSLNMKPTLVELRGYFDKYKRDNQIDFAEFLNILHVHLQTENASQEILDGFRAYDVNKTGLININELKSILTTTGERLSNKDVDLIIQEVKTNRDESISYEKLVQILNRPIS